MSPIIGLNAHLLSNEAGYRRAGIHSYMWQLLDHLPAADPEWRYRVFVGQGQPPDRPALQVRRSRMATEHPLTRIVWEQVVQPWQLGGLDLVHELAFVAPVFMPRPFVVTIYDLTFMRYPERLPRARQLYLRLLTELSCKRARRVIAISESTADDLVNLLHIPRERIDVAVPGVDTRFCRLPTDAVAEWRNRKHLPDRFLLYLGTLEPRKNLPTLLRAYAALPAADRNSCHLVIAGGRGWSVDEIYRTIDQFGLSSAVHLPGFVDDEELCWWYNAAEAFVYPSVFEGWGLPVTEAMACGKPVVVSRISSLPEAVGETGLTVPPHDVLAWTDALKRCIHDEAWRTEQGERALARASQFTWTRTAERTVASYRKALEIVRYA